MQGESILKYGSSVLQRKEITLLELKHEYEMLLEQYARTLEELKALRQAKETDTLTGAFNREFFDRDVTRQITFIARYQYNTTIAVFELDQVEKFIQKEGTEVFNTVMAHLAKISFSELRETDLVARISETLFAIVLPHAELEKAGEILDRLKDKLVDKKNISLSFGATGLHRNDSVDGVLSRANQALKQAQGEGGNMIKLVTM